MGKETVYKIKPHYTLSFYIQPSYSKEFIEALSFEAYKLWQPNICVKEDDKERKLRLKGFKRKDNKAEEIFKVLLMKRLIFLETKLLTFCQYKDNT